MKNLFLLLLATLRSCAGMRKVIDSCAGMRKVIDFDTMSKQDGVLDRLLSGIPSSSSLVDTTRNACGTLALKKGAHLGNYVLGHCLGAGGFGETWTTTSNVVLKILNDREANMIDEAKLECAFAHSRTRKLSGVLEQQSFVDCSNFGEAEYDNGTTTYFFMALGLAPGTSIMELMFDGDRGSAVTIPEFPTVIDVLAAVAQMSDLLDVMMAPTRGNPLRHFHLDFQLQNIMFASGSLSVIDYGLHLVCCAGKVGSCDYAVVSGGAQSQLPVQSCDNAAALIGQMYAVQQLISNMLSMFATGDTLAEILSSIQKVANGESAAQEAERMVDLVRPAYRKDWATARPVVEVALDDMATLRKSLGPGSSRESNGKALWPPKLVGLLS